MSEKRFSSILTASTLLTVLAFSVCFLLTTFLIGCAQPQPQPQPETPKETQKISEVQRSEEIPEMFSPSKPCSKCHNGLKDSFGNDVSIHSSWRNTMLANAAKDPYFLAKLTSEIEKFSGDSKIIERECAKCHTPMAAFQAKVDGEESALFTLLEKDNQYHELAVEGVSCTLCHQIENKRLGNEDSFSGNYSIDSSTFKPDRLIYGPFEPEMAELMRGVVGYLPKKGEQIEKAELCAICHTLYTPYFDEKGEFLGHFPEQTPYLEWLSSSYAKKVSCQSCHMPQTKGVRISKIPANPKFLPARSPFYIHEFAGGNVQILKLMGMNASATLDKLKSAVSVSLETEREGDKLVVKVRILNFAGHKFPTGFPSRRAWIYLKVVDGEGKTIFESGNYTANGRIIGEDEPFEKHHDVITSENEVQIYESVMVDSGGMVTSTLLRAAEYIKDNRILPEGADPNKMHSDTVPRGVDGDENFIGGSDTVTYTIADDGRARKVLVEVFYQPVSHRFLSDLSKTPTALVNEFLGNYGKMEKTTVVAVSEKILE
ncbi:MAG: hypothetical protein H0Z28_02300 [Archaeoglobus sp.]|nr:hypothetical protein [Archaeoglobus sp.]